MNLTFLKHSMSLCGITLYILMAAMFAACHRDVTAQSLQHASEIMDAHPDSAFLILNPLDRSHMNDEQRAAHALLLSQSRHKIDLGNDSDTLLNDAVSYYMREHNDTMLMKSLFYRSDAYMQQRLLTDAILDASRAWDISQNIPTSTSAHYWRAKIAELIADINNHTANSVERYNWTKIAVREYGLAGREDNQIFSSIDLAFSEATVGGLQRSVEMFDSIRLLLPQYKQYPNLELFFYEAAIPVVVQHASPSEANDYFESYIQVHQRDDLSIRDKYQKAIIDIRNDSISKAINQIESLKHQPVEGWDSMLAVSAQYLLAQKLKDYRDQATLGDSLLKINVRYYMESMNQRALPIQRDYYADKARESEFKLDTLHSRSTITLSCLILILLTGIIIYFIRINIHKLQHENEARRIVALNHEVDYYRSENTSLTKALESNISDSIKHQSSLFKEKWILLNKLCNNLADDSNPTEISQTIILRQIKATLEEINRPDNLKEIEDQVNKYNDNVILLLRSECAFLKETAISLITLYIAGFSSKSICFITGTKLKTFYTRRDRIINKIQEADFSKTELIMTLLKNRNT